MREFDFFIEMSFQVVTQKQDLPQIARQAFNRAVAAVDASAAVETAVRIDGERLFVADAEFDLNRTREIYAVALGKAAFKMAQGLSRSLGAKLTGGVISAVKFDEKLSDNWQTFVGGHPTPNRESLTAARAAFELLKIADKPESLVIFLVSGGGSAMMEMLVDDRITLADLQTANKILVNCGATIGEVNAIRRGISKVKGGGLTQILINANAVSLIISDTNDNEAFNVASGPTIEPDLSETEIQNIVERYGLREKLPETVCQALENVKPKIQNPKSKIQNWTVLRSNRDAIEAAANFLREQNFVVEVADDLVETLIDTGCAELVKRLLTLREKTTSEKSVALVSGGEFVCPVRGNGVGGRNLESALRTAVLFDEPKRQGKFAALFAGTDGIDGGSTAAGAVVDENTFKLARELNLDAREFLTNSDSDGFFTCLNQRIEIGATGTNVRDVRILLAV